ncbi:T-cell surface glycoprotein CD3 epsilon chain [Pristimantis euphronides]
MRPWVVLSALMIGLGIGDISIYAADSDYEEQEQHNFQVSISGLSVDITCPTSHSGIEQLKKDNKPVGARKDDGKFTLDNYSPDNNGLYSCGSDHLYLHAYVCETCTEVSIMMVACVVIADCLITIGVCLFVYMFCKRKPGPARDSGYTGARKKGNNERPPPVPNPDYEPIQKRRQDVYDGLNHNVK